MVCGKTLGIFSVDGLLGAGSLYSSLEDLSLWDRALFPGRLFPKAAWLE